MAQPSKRGDLRWTTVLTLFALVGCGRCDFEESPRDVGMDAPDAPVMDSASGDAPAGDAPTDVVPPGDSAAIDTGGTCAPVVEPERLPCSGSCTCDAGQACRVGCEDGGCSLTCASDSSCTLTCNGGGCDVTCEAGAVCRVRCGGGGCRVTCADGAACDIGCGGGGCMSDCAASATCC